MNYRNNKHNPHVIGGNTHIIGASTHIIGGVYGETTAPLKTHVSVFYKVKRSWVFQRICDFLQIFTASLCLSLAVYFYLSLFSKVN